MEGDIILVGREVPLALRLVVISIFAFTSLTASLELAFNVMDVCGNQKQRACDGANATCFLLPYCPPRPTPGDRHDLER
jgi:hypothetical protein